MSDTDPLAELLSEMKRLHRRLDVMSKEHQMMLARIKRIEQKLDAMARKADIVRDLTDLDADIDVEPIDVPPDLRKFFPD